MNYYKTERNAIYETAKIFTDYGWIFREQAILDLGIDALVETPIDSYGQIKVFALQVKGGDNNFFRSKKGLIFYFSERHFIYWNAIIQNYPLLIILQDPSTGKIYWEHYNAFTVTKTKKHYKVEVPLENILNKSSKETIFDTITKWQAQNKNTIPNKTKAINKPLEDCPLSVRYFLDKEAGANLYMSIRYKNLVDIINLNYKPKKKEWDYQNSLLNWENEFYFTLIDFEKYIRDQFNKKNKNRSSFEKLVDEINILTQNGLQEISEKMFDHHNQEASVPKYKQFIHAFELHTKLKKKSYKVKTVGSVIHFKVKYEIFEMSTYENLTQLLKIYLKNKSYDEIYTQTEKHIWEEIYSDPGIEKAKFIPIMQNEWEYYWNGLYLKIKKEVGHTNYLDKMKDESLRKLTSFINLYNESANKIELAYDFDEDVLYPMAVITMLHIYDSETCFNEYCELEFYSGDKWESISLDDDRWNSPVFFIKEYEY